jgi:hypothetical protein
MTTTIESISLDLGARADDLPPNFPTAAALAERFGLEMQSTLSLEELVDVNRKNDREKDAGICHSGDACDSNMVMHAAFAHFGIDPLGASGLWSEQAGMHDGTGRLWDAAWNIAKAAHFGLDEELERLEDGTFAFSAGGVEIRWPLASSCGRFAVEPSDYGFEVEHTGGGCTAWRRDFVFRGQHVHMLITTTEGDSHEVERGDEIAIGVYRTADEGTHDASEGDWFVVWTATEHEVAACTVDGVLPPEPAQQSEHDRINDESAATLIKAFGSSLELGAGGEATLVLRGGA